MTCKLAAQTAPSAVRDDAHLLECIEPSNHFLPFSITSRPRACALRLPSSESGRGSCRRHGRGSDRPTYGRWAGYEGYVFQDTHMFVTIFGTPIDLWSIVAISPRNGGEEGSVSASPRTVDGGPSLCIVLCMATKTLSVDEEAYRALVRARRHRGEFILCCGLVPRRIASLGSCSSPRMFAPRFLQRAITGHALRSASSFASIRLE